MSKKHAVVESTFSWKKPVIDILNNPPSTPSGGDRYLIGQTPTGAWSGFSNQYTIWTQGAWDIYSPTQGDVVNVKNDDVFYTYDLGAWVLIDKKFKTIRGIPVPLALAGNDGNIIRYNNTTGAYELVPSTSGSTSLLSVGGKNSPYFKTKKSSYQVARAFKFNGTNTGTPKSVSVIAWTSNINSPAEWAIYDVTNAQTIATGSTAALSQTISSDTVLTNLPTAEAIFEVWIRRGSGGAGTVYISNVEVHY